MKSTTIEEVLREYITRDGVSIKHIVEQAKKCGFHLPHSSVRMLVSGAVSNPGVVTLQAVAAGLGVPREEMAAAAFGIKEPNRRALNDPVTAPLIGVADPSPLTDNERKLVEAELKFHLLMEQENTLEVAGEIDQALVESHEAIEAIIKERGLRAGKSNRTDGILDAEYITEE